ncbi:MAG TPA: hypothetical protein VGD77_03095 [Gemmatimonadaceae bacterium]
MQPLVVRAPVPTEWGPARVHVGEWADATRHHARLLELLGEALEQPGPEGEVLAAFEGAALRGVAIFGFVAGSDRAARLGLLAADAPDVAGHLAQGVARQLAARGARMVVAEWPDEPPFVAAAARLRELGWSEAGRIADYVAPGVDLVILRQR